MTASADTIIALLARRGETVATAESLTGGQVCAALIDPPGASAVVAGGVVAYSAAVKSDLLGVEADLIATRGTVDADVAVRMAEGVRKRLASTWAVATTGEAGPQPAEDKPVGTVYVAVAGPNGTRVQHLTLAGVRDDVRRGATSAGLSLLLATLEEQSTDPRR